MARQYQQGVGIKYVLAGGSVVAALGLLADVNGLTTKKDPDREVCQEVVQEKSFLSRDVLAQFLAVPEGVNKEQVRQVVQSPYCRLASMEIRSGAISQREAYPLAFDPQTWLVVLYEGESYTGYSFSFRH